MEFITVNGFTMQVKISDNGLISYSEVDNANNISYRIDHTIDYSSDNR